MRQEVKPKKKAAKAPQAEPKKPDKKKPGKLPKDFQKSITDNSRDAADTALKRFFSGR